MNAGSHHRPDYSYSTTGCNAVLLDKRQRCITARLDWKLYGCMAVSAGGISFLYQIKKNVFALSQIAASCAALQQRPIPAFV